jgi:DNA topoisomerase-1
MTETFLSKGLPIVKSERMAYTLLVCEKPSAAKRIADALAEGDAEQFNKGGAAYYRIKRKGREIFVVPAVGHLFVLHESKSNITWNYPVFSVEWKPTYEMQGSAWAKKYYQNIKSLAKGASDFISACDYDIEGSTIAYNILRFICSTEKGRRMKFSTLTKPDLVEAYEHASPELDYPQIEAGLTRHQLDFLWGINVSRALTLALRAAGAYRVLSTGRVQGPTLEILEKRETEIGAFRPKPFWQLQLTGLYDSKEVVALHEKDKFWEQKEAEGVFSRCNGKPAKVFSVQRSEQSISPPYPFDLTTLQRDSYLNFGLSPKQTLDVAQGLYEQALISYPRTSSQKLPEKIGFRPIIEGLARQKAYEASCSRLLSMERLRPREGAKSDPAHPAIFPTGNKPKALTEVQRKLYDLITKRFLAAFAEPALRETMKVVIEIEKEKFIAQGSRTLVQNWMEFYRPYTRFKEQLLPDMKAGDSVKVQKLELLKKSTQPPARFSQASILKEMESLGLGTKATRAQILQTLYDRGYIEEKSIAVTRLGKAVVDALEKYCPDIVSVELTRKFEKEMEEIQEEKKPGKRQEVIGEAEETLKKILDVFKRKEKEIGNELKAQVLEQMKAESTLGKCKCGGDLVTRYSKAKKRFVGCGNYPKCTETFSLPQKGSIKILREKCKTCGLYIVAVKSFKKRPWKLCIRCGFVNKRGEGAEENKDKSPESE